MYLYLIYRNNNNLLLYIVFMHIFKYSNNYILHIKIYFDQNRSSHYDIGISSVINDS